MTQRISASLVYYILLLAAVLAFNSLLNAGYLNFDDPGHAFQNELLLRPSDHRIRDIFLSPDSVFGTYIPLSVFSFHIESALFSFNPFVSHAINLVLHLLVSFLVVVLGGRLGFSKKAAMAAGAIFLLHPMHIESMAWVTCRKDLLYSSFYLAALILYCQYIEKKEGRFYIGALLCAALSIFSKPMALSLPLGIILVDWFKGRPLNRAAVMDKIPFFLVVEPLALITYVMNQRMPDLATVHSPFIWLWSAMFYIEKFFLPVGLHTLYSLPNPVVWWNAEYLKASGVFFVLVFLLWRFRKERSFVLAVSLYVVSTFFLWRFDGVKDLCVVADRFMYLPSIGFCFFLGAFVEQRLLRYQKAAMISLAALVVAVVIYDNQLSLRWSNSLRYWEAADLRYATSSVVYTLRAQALLAGEAHNISREEQERFVFGYFTRQGWPKDKVARIREHELPLRMVMALSDLRQGLMRFPKDSLALSLSGAVMLELKNYKAAFRHLNHAVAWGQDDQVAWFLRGEYYAATGQWRKAVRDYTRAIGLNPGYSLAYARRAVACDSLGYPALAQEDRNRAKALGYGK